VEHLLSTFGLVCLVIVVPFGALDQLQMVHLVFPREVCRGAVRAQYGHLACTYLGNILSLKLIIELSTGLLYTCH
jgi:hypothetical protein